MDFFAVDALADAVLETLADPVRARAMGAEARVHAGRFDRASGLARYDELIAPRRAPNGG